VQTKLNTEQYRTAVVGTNHISGMTDRLRWCQLRWTVCVENWWGLTSLSHWPYTFVYNTALCRSVINSGDLFLGLWLHWEPDV